jgi:hypothetical protein
MNVKSQINQLISTQAEPKQSEMQSIHNLIIELNPNCKLWFFDGKNDLGKQVAHPTIGYGEYTITYKNGSSRNFFKVGLLANPSGITIHVMGIKDKNFLLSTYGQDIGKAKIGTYAISFKAIKEINLNVLKIIIKNRFETNT